MTTAPASESALDLELTAERTAALFSKGLAPHVANGLVAVLVGVAVWAQLPAGMAAAWVVGSLLVSGVRFALWWRYRAVQPPPAQAAVWLRRFVWAGSANGVMWGALGVVLFPLTDVRGQSLFMLVIAGLIAGSTALTASHLPAFLSFAVPTLLPLALRVAGGADSWSLSVAGILLVFFGMMTSIARRASRDFGLAATLRLTNQKLLQDLSGTREALLQLNRELEGRVADRTVELKKMFERQLHSDADLVRFRALLDQAGSAILVVDEPTLRVVDANEAAAVMLQKETQAVVAASLPELDVAGIFESERTCRAFVSELPPDEPRVFEDLRVNADGVAKAVEVSVARRALQGQSLLLIVMRDISARKSFEARLAQAGLLASVGGLAAGVAHEVNNPLAYILSNLGYMRQALVGAGPLAETVRQELLSVTDESLEGAERVKKIVGDLATLSRRVPDTLELVDVQNVLQTCISVAMNSLRHRARVVEDFEKVPLVKANRARLTQVFLNLLVNAAQAIREGNPDEHEVRICTRWSGKGQPVIVEISDTGVGIPTEERDRVFQPFFTTKGPSGVGLGLAVCHSLIDSMGGSITFESREGRGTRFFVSLEPVDAQSSVTA